MISTLHKYYDEVGISAIGFNCRYYKECRSECEDKLKFTKAREPYIGQFYKKRKTPRLLFLSLDSGDEVHNPKRKTMQAVREANFNFPPEERAKNKHWYRTHQFTWMVFSELNKLSKNKWNIGKTDRHLGFEPATEIFKIMPYFAHTNSAKCCMNKKHSAKANKALFENCKGYIPKELKILNPHILIPQGDEARKVVEDAIIYGFFSMIKKVRNISKANPKKHDTIIIEINRNKQALWIHHYHPSNWGAFNKKVFPKYNAYAKVAAKFIADNYPQLLK